MSIKPNLKGYYNKGGLCGYKGCTKPADWTLVISKGNNDLASELRFSCSEHQEATIEEGASKWQANRSHQPQRPTALEAGRGRGEG